MAVAMDFIENIGKIYVVDKTDEDETKAKLKECVNGGGIPWFWAHTVEVEFVSGKYIVTLTVDTLPEEVVEANPTFVDDADIHHWIEVILHNVDDPWEVPAIYSDDMDNIRFAIESEYSSLLNNIHFGFGASVSLDIADVGGGDYTVAVTVGGEVGSDITISVIFVPV